jgi:hypothetical protein
VFAFLFWLLGGTHGWAKESFSTKIAVINLPAGSHYFSTGMKVGWSVNKVGEGEHFLNFSFSNFQNHVVCLKS